HGKALKTSGKAPNCVVCHGSHNIKKAEMDIINESLCGACHSYDRAKTIKASLLLTEKKIKEIDNNLNILKTGLISTEDTEKVLFQTHAEFRTLFHTVDVKLVKDRTGEFDQRLAGINEKVRKGFQELSFRQNFSLIIMFIFVGLGIAIFFLGRREE
ncbi:MAG: hypothetical protein HY887_00790, partial [Deltaproteobacteria bacterium]|nr:hypothetical protein [Deltaproteobacteria bacterium]